MVHLYETGYSLAKVGDRLGFNPTTVLRQLKVQGVATRRAHGHDQTS